VKSIQEKNVCQFIQRIQENGQKPEIGVISQKYNPQFFVKDHTAENAPLTIKK